MLLDSSKREVILEAFAAGARGVVSRDESVETLSKCVRRVHEGQIWANTEQMAALVEAMASSLSVRAVDARGMNLLSKRELQIVRSVAQGLTNHEIAKQLDLSPHTIKNSLFRIFDKLGVSNRVELLLMTMSQDRHVHCALQCVRDEATLTACQRAAEEGVITGELALAQFYAGDKTNLNNVLHAYAWYLIASERISQALKNVTKTMTVDQVLQAEQMAARWLDNKGNTPLIRTNCAAKRNKSAEAEKPDEIAVGQIRRGLIKQIRETKKCPSVPVL